MRDILVEFTDNGARIHKDPEVIEAKKHQDNVLLNPELPMGVSPAFWRKEGNYIRTLSVKEAKDLLNIQNFNKAHESILKKKLQGVHIKPNYPKKDEPKPEIKPGLSLKVKIAIALGAASVLGALLLLGMNS